MAGEFNSHKKKKKKFILNVSVFNKSILNFGFLTYIVVLFKPDFLNFGLGSKFLIILEKDMDTDIMLTFIILNRI